MEIGLESHWGIGPKTREKLVSELGIEGARDAILSDPTLPAWATNNPKWN